jgi:serine protease Do
VGDKVTLAVMRKGKRQDLPVEVARRPAPRDVLATRETGEWWRGMRIEPLTEELKAQTGLKPADQGAFVREVRDGSPAADAGIVPGMVIDQVGDKKVAAVKEFHDATASVQGPCIVHVIGIGVKVIQPPGGAAPDKNVPERPKGGKSPRKRSESKGEKPPSGKPDSEAMPQE